MKQTNFMNCRLSLSTPRFAKPLGITVVCLALMFILGTQLSYAQTMEQTGEIKSAAAITLVEGETQFLKQEYVNPVGSVKTTYNGLLAAYYSNVVKSFVDGSDMRVAFIDHAKRMTYDSALIPSNAQGWTLIDFTGLENVVNQLDLSDDSDNDLEAIFNFWRTLKNK